MLPHTSIWVKRNLPQAACSRRHLILSRPIRLWIARLSSGLTLTAGLLPLTGVIRILRVMAIISVMRGGRRAGLMKCVVEMCTAFSAHQAKLTIFRNAIVSQRNWPLHIYNICCWFYLHNSQLHAMYHTHH